MTDKLIGTYRTDVEGSDLAVRHLLSILYTAEELLEQAANHHLSMLLWTSSRIEGADVTGVQKFSQEMDALTSAASLNVGKVFSVVAKFAHARHVGIQHVVLTRDLRVLNKATRDCVTSTAA